MGEAKYGEPWKASGPHAVRNDAGTFIAETNSLVTDHIVACVNSMAGIANVEALGDYLKAAKELSEYAGANTHSFPLNPDANSHAPLRLWVPFWAAEHALYAPQASEAKPL
jgi:hypothetical protein